MARTSEVVYPYKSGLLNELFVFCSAGNVGDFCSFKGYGILRRCQPAENSKIRKKLYFAFSVKQNAFL